MVKDKDTVIHEFHDLVNMSPAELWSWLQKEQSQSSGWQSESGGETIGHERYFPVSQFSANPVFEENELSGRRIVDILAHNPDRDPEEYTEHDIEHMRKTVAYCKRHLAQEEKAKSDTGSKSYRSLKNWGHDVLKE
ncbi:DUF3140 domain-containing protein [Aspergillus glaucus CBS 516.65]|uniref:Uncharacterized protein n=1 Tax=Aspergillus glaucus CBS 516.65 TaxID=1160497 RepID=A0A1L9VFE8_ASPGL|nr:hypothetical protein ASPGLDRAFT_26876 [Aspergillus glaucus CBS 516.65]OJJ82614.1 hypothetical protein ASPGLDRAFT_26876 [Aspergillus glaucus CBS 516.65]